MTRSIVEAEAQSSAVSMLYHHLEIPENVEALLDTLFVLIPQYGLVQGNRAAVQEMAEELLGEVVKEVLTHGDRYDPSRSKPGTWLNGAAVIIIKRKRAEIIKLNNRERNYSGSPCDRERGTGSSQKKVSLLALTTMLGFDMLIFNPQKKRLRKT